MLSPLAMFVVGTGPKQNFWPVTDDATPADGTLESVTDTEETRAVIVPV